MDTLKRDCGEQKSGYYGTATLNRNAFMHDQITKGNHEEVPKLVYTLLWCKPVVRPVFDKSVRVNRKPNKIMISGLSLFHLYLLNTVPHNYVDYEY